MGRSLSVPARTQSARDIDRFEIHCQISARDVHCPRFKILSRWAQRVPRFGNIPYQRRFSDGYGLGAVAACLFTWASKRTIFVQQSLPLSSRELDNGLRRTFSQFGPREKHQTLKATMCTLHDLLHPSS